MALGDEMLRTGFLGLPSSFIVASALIHLIFPRQRPLRMYKTDELRTSGTWHGYTTCSGWLTGLEMQACILKFVGLVIGGWLVVMDLFGWLIYWILV